MLDESFQHEVWNARATSRYILLVDFFHPDLALEEKEAIRHYGNSLGEGAWRIDAPDENSAVWDTRR